jgi:hypothetical protein
MTRALDEPRSALAVHVRFMGITRNWLTTSWMVKKMKRTAIAVTVVVLGSTTLFLASGLLHLPKQRIELRTLGELSAGTNEFSFVVPDGIRSDHLELLSFLIKSKPSDATLSGLSGAFCISDGQTVWKDSLSETNLIGYLSQTAKTPGVFPLYGNPKTVRGRIIQSGWPASYEEGRTFTCLFVVDSMPDAALAFQIEWATDRMTIWK